MRFSFLAVIVALAASIMFVNASEIPTRGGEGTLSYDALPESRDQIIGVIEGVSKIKFPCIEF
jgi:hypothetical protein